MALLVPLAPLALRHLPVLLVFPAPLALPVLLDPLVPLAFLGLPVPPVLLARLDPLALLVLPVLPVLERFARYYLRANSEFF
jgi:hypothetical protein